MNGYRKMAIVIHDLEPGTVITDICGNQDDFLEPAEIIRGILGALRLLDIPVEVLPAASEVLKKLEKSRSKIPAFIGGKLVNKEALLTHKEKTPARQCRRLVK